MSLEMALKNLSCYQNILVDQVLFMKLLIWVHFINTKITWCSNWLFWHC